MSPVHPSAAPTTIALAVDAALGLPAEGYRLSLDQRGMAVTGRDPAGLFCGVQTLPR